MRNFVLSTTLLLVFSSSSFAGTPWENYVASPSPDNASKVESIKYSSPTPNAQTKFEHLELLQANILKGDYEALLLGLRLLSDTNVDQHQIFDIISGSVSEQPDQYLKAVGTFQFGSCPAVTTTDCVDNLPLCQQQIDARINALSSIEEPSLSDVKEICLSKLQEKNRKLTNRLRGTK